MRGAIHGAQSIQRSILNYSQSFCFVLFNRFSHGIRNHCAWIGDFECLKLHLALRGLRTMGVRLQQHSKSGIKVARWLAARPEVEAVMHPALPDHPGHSLWKRDFKGACGLFAIALHKMPTATFEVFILKFSLTASSCLV